VMSQVGIHLSIAFSVALGGGVLEAMRVTHGGEPALFDFHVAFWVLTGIGLLSAVIFARMPKTASMHIDHGKVQESPAE